MKKSIEVWLADGSQATVTDEAFVWVVENGGDWREYPPVDAYERNHRRRCTINPRFIVRLQVY